MNTLEKSSRVELFLKQPQDVVATIVSGVDPVLREAFGLMALKVLNEGNGA
jgi:hypothetical protein